jgi:hypothetical protein
MTAERYVHWKEPARSVRRQVVALGEILKPPRPRPLYQFIALIALNIVKTLSQTHIAPPIRPSSHLQRHKSLLSCHSPDLAPSKMRQKRAKTYKRLMALYVQTFAFRSPFQVLGEWGEKLG